MKMIRHFMGCIREYKKPTVLTLLCMVGEVAIEVLIPFFTANLVNEIKNGAALQNRFVDKQAFPIAHNRNGVAFAVGGNRKLCIVHVFCIIRILGTNLVQRHDLSRSDKWLCIRIGEEKEHVRFRTRLKIRQDPGFPFLAGHIGAIGHQISGRGLVGRDGSFKIPAVAVLAAEGGHDPQRHGFRLRRLFPSCAAA